MITTHVLDTASGRPAKNMVVALERQTSAGWELLGRGKTDADGRLRTLLPEGYPLQAGNFRLTFETHTPFYPCVVVTFTVADPSQHYHVPLLLSPFGYSTYRGS